MIVHGSLLDRLSMPHAKVVLEALLYAPAVRELLKHAAEKRLMHRVFLLAGILMAAAPVGGSEPLTLRVSPMQSFAPANLYIRLSIEPNANNRVVSIVAESEDYYRSSEVALEGEQGPRTVIVQFRSVPEGQYQIRSAVENALGKEVATARQNINVLPGNDK